MYKYENNRVDKPEEHDRVQNNTKFAIKIIDDFNILIQNGYLATRKTDNAAQNKTQYMYLSAGMRTHYDHRR